MKSEQFSAALSRLHGVINDIERAWSETCAHWDDDTRRHFEEFRLQPILDELKGVIEATLPVRECFAHARRACVLPEDLYGGGGRSLP